MKHKPPLRHRSTAAQRRWILKQEDQRVRRAFRTGIMPTDWYPATPYPSRGRRTKNSGRQRLEQVRAGWNQMWAGVGRSGQVGSFFQAEVIETQVVPAGVRP